jgi:hypothetical protein
MKAPVSIRLLQSIYRTLTIAFLLCVTTFPSCDSDEPENIIDTRAEFFTYVTQHTWVIDSVYKCSVDATEYYPGFTITFTDIGNCTVDSCFLEYTVSSIHPPFPSLGGTLNFGASDSAFKNDIVIGNRSSDNIKFHFIMSYASSGLKLITKRNADCETGGDRKKGMLGDYTVIKRRS